jgi:uncharacterized protein YneF (UPF0154 family)
MEEIYDEKALLSTMGINPSEERYNEVCRINCGVA